MNQLNSLILEGTLVRNVEITEPDVPVASGMVSVIRHYKNHKGNDEEEYSIFEVVASDNLAKVFKEKGCKGRGVRIVGRLKQVRWHDSDGKEWSKVFVIAEHIELKPVKSEVSNDSE